MNRPSLLYSKKDGEGTVSAFQATTSALANTVGASNIVGVPVAIARGGPGAIFWMWAASFFGLAIKWAEISLGVAYRQKDNADDTYVGGPPYYLEKGLGMKWLGFLLALVVTVNVIGVCALSKKARELKRDFFDNPKYVPQKEKK